MTKLIKLNQIKSLKLNGLRALKNHPHFNKATAAVAVILVAIIGTVLLFNTRAATPFASLDLGTGSSISPPASVIADGTASGNSAVQFGNAVPPPPSGSDPCATYPALPATKPTAANTGVPAGTALTASGDIVVTTDGEVIDSKNVTGSIYVNANNVTIKNSRVTDNGLYPIKITSGFSGVKVLHSEVYGPAPNGNYTGIRVEGTNSFICGNYIHGSENGITIVESGSVIQANFIEKLYYINPDPTAGPVHYDGIEVYGGNNQKLWGNNILVTDSSGNWLTDTAAINPAPYGGSIVDNLEIKGNWMGGGSNTLNLDQKDTSILSNVRVTNNRWYRSPAGICRCYAPPPAVWSGNVWDDTGELIPQP